MLLLFFRRKQGCIVLKRGGSFSLVRFGGGKNCQFPAACGLISLHPCDPCRVAVGSQEDKEHLGN